MTYATANWFHVAAAGRNDILVTKICFIAVCLLFCRSQERFLSSLLNTRVTSISFVTVGFTHVDVRSIHVRCKNMCKL